MCENIPPRDMEHGRNQNTVDEENPNHSLNLQLKQHHQKHAKTHMESLLNHKESALTKHLPP